MKKGYYFFDSYLENAGSVGVAQKIDMQIKQFHQEFEIELLPLLEVQVSLFGKAIRRMPFASFKRNYSEITKEITTPDYIYIRFISLDRSYINFLKDIKAQFPKCKIIIELFTYPYEKDLFVKLRSKPALWKDRFYRRFYPKYVDRFVTYTEDKEIFGIPCINTMNGIDVASVPVVNEKKREKDTINLLFIGFMQRHHGLERIIRGLKQYSGKNRIKCFFVGDGPELDRYKELTDKYELNDVILFLGKKTGAELDKICDESDIAISSLGIYKIMAPDTRLSALKNREYLARGLPIITGCPQDVFEKYPCDYHLQFNNDDSDIDIDKVMEWYHSLLSKYGTREELALKIREYGYAHIDNSATLKPIIDYINE